MSHTSPGAAPAENDSFGTFELVTVPLPTLAGRERSIPIRLGDLGRLLQAEPGLSVDDRASLTQLVKLIGSVYHNQFHTQLNDLKDLYAPIDPDSDCVAIKDATTPPSDGADAAFLVPFEAALVRANYVQLDLQVLEKAISAPNELGLDYIPDLKLFDHLRVYVRGHGRVTRVIRRARSWFRKKTFHYDAYRRVVIALKYRADSELDEYVRSDVLYLRMFKDVPFVEMDMHFPEHGTKIRMRLIDKLQIASPMVTGLPTIAAKILLAATFSPALLALILFAPISAGVRSFFGYRTARRRYLHIMIRHLYYLTLANNASVINRLIDSAEEEEFKETVLAYFVLWRGLNDSTPWTDARLDAEVEKFLQSKTGCELDFETSDAIAKLLRLGLVSRDGQGNLVAVPLDRAVQLLVCLLNDSFDEFDLPQQPHHQIERR
jgi:Protein of unknown function (DUF3754)